MSRAPLALALWPILLLCSQTPRIRGDNKVELLGTGTTNNAVPARSELDEFNCVQSRHFALLPSASKYLTETLDIASYPINLVAVLKSLNSVKLSTENGFTKCSGALQNCLIYGNPIKGHEITQAATVSLNTDLVLLLNIHLVSAGCRSLNGTNSCLNYLHTFGEVCRISMVDIKTESSVLCSEVLRRQLEALSNDGSLSIPALPTDLDGQLLIVGMILRANGKIISYLSMENDLETSANYLIKLTEVGQQLIDTRGFVLQTLNNQIMKLGPLKPYMNLGNLMSLTHCPDLLIFVLCKGLKFERCDDEAEEEEKLEISNLCVLITSARPRRNIFLDLIFGPSKRIKQLENNQGNLLMNDRQLFLNQKNINNNVNLLKNFVESLSKDSAMRFKELRTQRFIEHSQGLMMNYHNAIRVERSFAAGLLHTLFQKIILVNKEFDAEISQIIERTLPNIDPTLVKHCYFCLETQNFVCQQSMSVLVEDNSSSITLQTKSRVLQNSEITYRDCLFMANRQMFKYNSKPLVHLGDFFVSGQAKIPGGCINHFKESSLECAFLLVSENDAEPPMTLPDDESVYFVIGKGGKGIHLQSFDPVSALLKDGTPKMIDQSSLYIDFTDMPVTIRGRRYKPSNFLDSRRITTFSQYMIYNRGNLSVIYHDEDSTLLQQPLQKYTLENLANDLGILFEISPALTASVASGSSIAFVMIVILTTLLWIFCCPCCSCCHKPQKYLTTKYHRVKSTDKKATNGTDKHYIDRFADSKQSSEKEVPE